MILTKKELKDYLKTEKAFYLPKKRALELVLTSDNSYKIYLYVRLLRYTEYYYNNRKNIVHKLLYALYRRKKNILGRKLGIELWENTFAKGLQIAHCGNIVVNGHSRIGENCILHGSNCIGNNGLSSSTPRLGNNIRVGVGAKIIGDVELADNVTVAAGAVVINSCYTEGAVLAGIPAVCVKINKIEKAGSNNE